MLATPDPVVTDAGWIKNVYLGTNGGVALLFSKAGSRRSSHWHKTDSHHLHVVEGCMHYYERPVGSTDTPTRVVVRAGETVFTGPEVEHWTEFPGDTGMVSISANTRTHEQHEADLVRVGWFE